LSGQSLAQIAKALGGEVYNGRVRAPGPGHSAADRSLSVGLSDDEHDGFVVKSFADDDVIVCRDYVRERLELLPFN
jgi:putative DNA primase/helicase